MDDRAFALELASIADDVAMRWWRPEGVDARAKADGSPVTDADVAVEEALLDAVRAARPGDAFLGEEVGPHPGQGTRRWIVDGIDGTALFAAGDRTWGTLVALEVDGAIVAGVCTSPAQERRWWASAGGGAFHHFGGDDSAQRLRVSNRVGLSADRVTTLPSRDGLPGPERDALDGLCGPVSTLPWSQQMRVAAGELDACVWTCGGVWDHAAPSLIVTEAGGRFTDFTGSDRLDTRTAIYSNGHVHDELLSALRS